MPRPWAKTCARLRGCLCAGDAGYAEVGDWGGWGEVGAVNRFQRTAIDFDILNGYQITKGKINE